MKNLFVAIITLLFISSCSSDDDSSLPAVVVEEEVITTMTIILTPNEGGTPIELKRQDLDGNGPNAPIVTSSENLAANTTYNGSIELLNELESPAIDITEEIEELAEEHQFFFQSSNALATFAYNDADGNGNPIGLNFTLTTGSSGNETVTITLIHEPMKDASGVSEGDDSNAGGEEDISATFSITIE